MKILSIDPGYDRLGIAIVEKIDGGKETLVFSETFETNKRETLPERCFALGERVAEIIEQFEPTELAIEKLFFNSNQKTAMGVAEARGVVIYAAMKKGLGVYEYTPLEIKTAVAGYGRANKKQVIEMTNRLITVSGDQTIKHDDEYDAIACGLTHFAIRRHY